jgi:hypothetical protein
MTLEQHRELHAQIADSYYACVTLSYQHKCVGYITSPLPVYSKHLAQGCWTVYGPQQQLHEGYYYI